MARELYPEFEFVTYDIAKGDNLKRFDEISGIIDEVFLPLPIFGVLEDNKLRVIVSGGPSTEAWKNIIGEAIEGVPVYVDDGVGRVELKKTIEDMEKIARLEDLFVGEYAEGSQRIFKSLIIPVLIAAVMDSINPCAINTLLVLLTFVIFSVGHGKVLRTGLAFSGAVFLTYFFMGLGFIQVFSHVYYLKYVVFALTFSLGVLMIIEFFRGDRKHLPSKFSEKITKYLERASNPWTGFIAGIVSASLLLPCSSAPYFLALNLISERTTLFGGLGLLLIYNVIIILPFLIITVCVDALGLRTMDMKLWLKGKRRLINLILGLGLICLSTLILYMMN